MAFLKPLMLRHNCITTAAHMMPGRRELLLHFRHFNSELWLFMALLHLNNRQESSVIIMMLITCNMLIISLCVCQKCYNSRDGDPKLIHRNCVVWCALV